MRPNIARNRQTPVSRNRIVHWRCLSGCVKIARSTWSCLVGASMTARRFDSVIRLAAADTASTRGRTYVLMAREAFTEIRAEYQICKMISAASFGGHWRAIESMVKLRKTISKSLSLMKTSVWDPYSFGSPRTLRITFLRSPDADSLISYAFKGVMI